MPLPKDARVQIGGFLALYNSQRDARKAASPTTKRRIDKIRRYANKLNDELHHLLADPIFFSADQPHWSSTPRPKHSDFEGLFSGLDQLQSVMGTAQSRMQMSPGRKSVDPIDFLVQMLSSVQARVTRDNVQRSSKNSDKAQSSRFIKLCCKKVGLTEPQIERSLKRTISSFHDTLTNHGFDISADEYVDDRHQAKSRRSRTAPDGHWRIRQRDAIAYMRAKKKKSTSK